MLRHVCFVPPAHGSETLVAAPWIVHVSVWHSTAHVVCPMHPVETRPENAFEVQAGLRANPLVQSPVACP
jgi:hypothetical protein